MDALNFVKENKHNERETHQNITTLLELEKLQRNKILTLEKTNHELEKNLAQERHDIRESKQQIEIFKSITNLIQNKNDTLEYTKKELEKLRSTNHTKLKELAQEKEISNELRRSQKTKTQKLEKKYYLTIAAAGVILAAIFVPYSFFTLSLIGEEHRVFVEPVNTGYVIQNLKGDTIDTWLSWRLVDGETLHINIVNGKKYQERFEVIKEAILSTESIEIDDSLLHKGPKGSTSLYYMGWAGALKEASKIRDTAYNIPTGLGVIESGRGEGDITIELTNMRNGDGFTGYTRTLADDAQNQILKSHITIYEIESLSDNQLQTIMRHELAHALGLAHASAPEDLMYPTIQTEFPYISECDIDALVHLYDGGKTSQVVCDK